jgi:hypothetical protein
MEAQANGVLSVSESLPVTVAASTAEAMKNFLLIT